MENGDFKLAATEKNRLEEKQRAMRKYMDKKGTDFTPAYFSEWKNPDDPNQTYYRYNGNYFEKDRKDRNWDRLPDIYTDKLPDDFEDYVSTTGKDTDHKDGKKKK